MIPAYSKQQLKDIKTALALMALLSLAALMVNAHFFQFTCPNYFPELSWPALGILMLSYQGCKLLLGENHGISLRILELIHFFAISLLVIIATMAVQLTPFPPIDQQLLQYESILQLPMTQILAWTHSHPRWQSVLNMAYASLTLQLLLIPLWLIVKRQEAQLREFYYLLVYGVLLGFSMYYFYPTTAPASVIDSPYFIEAQRATGLKFYQIHHQLQPSTLDGGMISLPSFHVIWAWLCQYSLRPWPLAFFCLLPLNCLLILSTVLLGWHYILDVLGSTMVMLCCHGLYYLALRRKNALVLLGKAAEAEVPG